MVLPLLFLHGPQNILFPIEVVLRVNDHAVAAPALEVAELDGEDVVAKPVPPPGKLDGRLHLVD